MGFSPKAARYAGISETRIVIVTMMISGALAGMMALNPIMGEQYRMQLDFVQGAGFVGIGSSFCDVAHRDDSMAFFKDKAPTYLGGPRAMARTRRANRRRTSPRGPRLVPSSHG